MISKYCFDADGQYLASIVAHFALSSIAQQILAVGTRQLNPSPFPLGADLKSRENDIALSIFI